MEGYSFSWMGGVPFTLPPQEKPFYLNGETAPVCREHVHTGRLYTRIDYSIFKKSSLFNKSKITRKTTISQQSKNS